MQQDNQVIRRWAISVADIVQLDIVAQGVEKVGEAWEGRLRQIPELISSYNIWVSAIVNIPCLENKPMAY